MGEILSFPQNGMNPVSSDTVFRGKLKGALVFVKNSLLERRKTSLVIKKSEFKDMLNGVKITIKDDSVEKALDDCFKEYFNDEVKQENNIIQMNDYMKPEEAISTIDDELDKLDNNSESIEKGGVAKVKSLSPFKSSGVDKDASGFY